MGDIDDDINGNKEDTTINSRTKTVCGTHGYLAPERENGEEYDAFAADWWALGVMVFAMLEGCLPFTKNVISMKRRKTRNSSMLAIRYIM